MNHNYPLPLDDAARAAMDAAETDAPNESHDESLVRQAHEAILAAKKTLKVCYTEATDEYHEDMFRNVITIINEALDELPEMPKRRETAEQRRLRKEQEQF